MRASNVSVRLHLAGEDIANLRQFSTRVRRVLLGFEASTAAFSASAASSPPPPPSSPPAVLSAVLSAAFTVSVNLPPARAVATSSRSVALDSIAATARASA